MFFVSSLLSVVRSGDSASLKAPQNVIYWELGKPYESQPVWVGIPSVREGDGSEGRGYRKKRMPPRNRADRAASNGRDTQVERLLTSEIGLD